MRAKCLAEGLVGGTLTTRMMIEAAIAVATIISASFRYQERTQEWVFGITDTRASCPSSWVPSPTPAPDSSFLLTHSAGADSSSWLTATHIGDLDGVSGSWFWPGPALALHPFQE